MSDIKELKEISISKRRQKSDKNVVSLELQKLLN